MWTNYGSQGVALATTVAKLSSLLGKTAYDFEFGAMRYVRLTGREVQDSDFNPEDPADARFLLKPHFLKRNEYEAEREVRFVTVGPAQKYAGTGVVLKNVNPTDWIQDVRLWPGLKPLEEEALQKTTAQWAPGIPCACSDLLGADQRSRNSMAARFEETFAEQDQSSWNDGSDNIPIELKRL